MARWMTVGLDEPETRDLRRRLHSPATLLTSELLPRLRIEQGQLLSENPDAGPRFVPIDKVVFHGIFENDFPLLSALALWGGPCLPRARGMMDARLRLPCLVRALEVTRFGTLRRGYADRGATVAGQGDVVAKWGEWHCGENKERVQGSWVCPEPTLLEPYIEGESVRVHLIDERAWQIRLTGTTWKKSLHGPGAAFMPLDAELAEDARRLQRHFGLEMLAMDYQIGTDGTKHLLEVNHIPNVTEFAEIREAYLDHTAAWLMGSRESA